MSTRLNKLLAERGVAARRKCDEIIAQGRVRVNGEVVSEAGTKVEEEDKITVDGKALQGRSRLSYFVLNKPVGVITTMDDPHGRRTIRDLLPRGARLFPVGRLDADTSGMLLLTNDGDLAHKLMHPRYGVEKIYRVRLAIEPTERQIQRLAQGVRFDEGLISAPARVRRIDPGFEAIMIEVVIHEGRFRQVRKMCEAVGLEVTGLHRVAYGPVRLGPLARGMWRELSEDEVERLRRACARPSRRTVGGSPHGSYRGGVRRSSANAGAPEREVHRDAPAARRPAPRPAPPREVEDADESDVLDTFVPGGGMVSDWKDDEEGATQWPARPAGRRGDAGWSGEGAEAGEGEDEAASRTARPGRRAEERARRTTPPVRSGRPAASEREVRTARATPEARATRPAQPVRPNSRGGAERERGPKPPRLNSRGAAERELRAPKPPRLNSRARDERVERAPKPSRPELRGGQRAARGAPLARFDRPAPVERRPRPVAPRPSRGPRPDRGEGSGRFERAGGVQRSGPSGRRERAGAPRPFARFERTPPGRDERIERVGTRKGRVGEPRSTAAPSRSGGFGGRPARPSAPPRRGTSRTVPVPRRGEARGQMAQGGAGRGPGRPTGRAARPGVDARKRSKSASKGTKLSRFKYRDR